MTKPHKHKDLIIAWANGETIQCWNNELQAWRDLCQPSFNSDVKFRVKPKTISINGIEVPAPVTDKLELHQSYFTPSLMDFSFYNPSVWSNSELDNDNLRRGIVHLSEKAAIQHSKALLSFTVKEDD